MLCITLILLVTAHSLQSATVTKETAANGEIVSDEPASCKGHTYCTVKSKNYPEKKFNEMFKNAKLPPTPSLSDVLDNRNNGMDLKDDCLAYNTIGPLYHVRENIHMPWRNVVQVPEQDFVQRVRLVTCKSSGSACFKPFTRENSLGVMTSCIQVFDEREVVVEADNSIGMERIKVELPMCCSCKYKYMESEH